MPLYGGALNTFFWRNMLRDAVQKEQTRWTVGRVLCIPFPDDMPLSWRASLVAAFLVQIVLAVKSAWLFRESAQSRRSRLYTDRSILFERTDGFDDFGLLGSGAELADRPMALGVR